MKKIRNYFERSSIFYIFVALYPLLFLWASNISQMEASEVIRPFLFTLVGTGALFGILWLIFRRVKKAALFGSLVLLAFFSYGHVYYLARSTPAISFLNHHTVLVPLYAVILGLAAFFLWRLKDTAKLFLFLNAAGLVLVAMQVFELSYAYIQTSVAESRRVELQSGLSVTENLRDMPDIYVITLDGYMRSDAMKQDMGYDNSDFIQQLKAMGFYVPDCSKPNYTFTYAAIASMLNMKYIPNAYANDVWSQFNSQGFWAIIQNDEVRAQLESVGYKTIAFQEEYPLLQFNDSDIVMGTEHPVIGSEYLRPFEVMYEHSTALILFNALDPNNKVTGFIHQVFANQRNANVEDMSGLVGQNAEFVKLHITSTLYILDHLTDAVAVAGPKFTYAHIFLPHYPYVFDPEGNILTDPGYYNGDRGGATTWEYEKKGYTNQVQYVDERILPILQKILTDSKNPPIIVLTGDHGLVDNNRITDLQAYYLPEGGNDLYPTMTPVNAFRIIFNKYFGAHYPILPDQTYTDDNEIVTDPYPACKP